MQNRLDCQEQFPVLFQLLFLQSDLILGITDILKQSSGVLLWNQKRNKNNFREDFPFHFLRVVSFGRGEREGRKTGMDLGEDQYNNNNINPSPPSLASQLL